MEIEHDELSDFMKELADSELDIPEKIEREVQTITEENMEDVLLAELGSVLATCKEVGETLADRIASGDTYEGTMMGFAQATDNLMKSLKFLDNRKTMKEKHQLELEKMQKAHELRMKEIEKRNEGRNTGVKSITNNVFVGSRKDFLKQAQLGMKNIDAIDVVATSSKNKTKNKK